MAHSKRQLRWTEISLAALGVLMLGFVIATTIIAIQTFPAERDKLTADVAACRVKVERRLLVASGQIGPVDDVAKMLASRIGSIQDGMRRYPLVGSDKIAVEKKLHELQDTRDMLQQLYDFHARLIDPKQMPENPEALESRRAEFAYIKVWIDKAVEKVERRAKEDRVKYNGGSGGGVF